MTLSVTSSIILASHTLTLLSILLIWTLQFKSDERKHVYFPQRLYRGFPLIYVWVLLGSILGITGPIFIHQDSFPFFLFYPGYDQQTAPNNTTTTYTVAQPASSIPLLLNSTTSTSSFTASLLVADHIRSVFGSQSFQFTVPAQLCIASAAIGPIFWVGAQLTLVLWTWNLYQHQRQRPGILNPHLLKALADPGVRDLPMVNPVVMDIQSEVDRRDIGDGTRISHSEQDDVTPVYNTSVRGSTRVWTIILDYVWTPLQLLGVVIQNNIRYCIGCCRPRQQQPQSYDSEQEAALENWSKRSMGFGSNDFGRFQGQEQASVDLARSINMGTSVGEYNLPSPTLFSSPSSGPAPSLADKLRVDYVDLRDLHEENYSYDMLGQGHFDRPPSKSTLFKRWARRHSLLFKEVVFCCIFPLVLFLALFFITARDREYEVCLDRGACIISSHSGFTDWITMLVVEIFKTVVSIISTTLAVLALHSFRRQNGFIRLNIWDLNPSPKILQLYLLTQTIKRYIVLCLLLNLGFTIAQCAHLGYFGLKHQSTWPSLPPKNDATPSTWISTYRPGTDSQAGYAKPLFRMPTYDREFYYAGAIVVAMLATISSLLLEVLYRRRTIARVNQSVGPCPTGLEAFEDSVRAAVENRYLDPTKQTQRNLAMVMLSDDRHQTPNDRVVDGVPDSTSPIYRVRRPSQTPVLQTHHGHPSQVPEQRWPESSTNKQIRMHDRFRTSWFKPQPIPPRPPGRPLNQTVHEGETQKPTSRTKSSPRNGEWDSSSTWASATLANMSMTASEYAEQNEPEALSSSCILLYYAPSPTCSPVSVPVSPYPSPGSHSQAVFSKHSPPRSFSAGRSSYFPEQDDKGLISPRFMPFNDSDEGDHRQDLLLDSVSRKSIKGAWPLHSHSATSTGTFGPVDTSGVGKRAPLTDQRHGSQEWDPEAIAHDFELSNIELVENAHLELAGEERRRTPWPMTNREVVSQSIFGGQYDLKQELEEWEESRVVREEDHETVTDSRYPGGGSRGRPMVEEDETFELITMGPICLESLVLEEEPTQTGTTIQILLSESIVNRIEGSRNC